MKKWFILFLTLLCLTGCAGSRSPIDRPYSLEVSYGESAVHAVTGGYQWIWRDGRDTPSTIADAADFRTTLEKIPYLNAGKDQTITLTFAAEPDRLSIAAYSGADNYTTPTTVEAADYKLTAPVDGGDYFYEVTAVWTESRKADCWGSATYWFRFLSQGQSANTAQLPQYSSLDIFQMVQLDPSALLGVEFLNNLEGTSKTCRTQADKTAILDYLKTNLSTEFQPASVAAPDPDYMLRLVCVDGTQLSLGYGTSSGQSWLLIGGSAYEAGTMDLAALWDGLEAGSVSQASSASGKHYLATSDSFPGDDWGSSFVYGYLTGLDNGTATYDEMRWIEDDAEPNGYRLEKGWSGQSMAVSADCVYWILDSHDKPYGQVSAQDLLSWSQDPETNVLFRFYSKDNQIIAICEQYQP